MLAQLTTRLATLELVQSEQMLFVHRYYISATLAWFVYPICIPSSVRQHLRLPFSFIPFFFLVPYSLFLTRPFPPLPTSLIFFPDFLPPFPPSIAPSRTFTLPKELSRGARQLVSVRAGGRTIPGPSAHRGFLPQRPGLLAWQRSCRPSESSTGGERSRCKCGLPVLVPGPPVRADTDKQTTLHYISEANVISSLHS